MSQVEFHYPVQNLHGKLNKKHAVIMRQKKYRAETGAVLREGIQESYTLYNPRDFTKTPAKGKELANMRSFGNASLYSSQLIRAGKYTEDELAAMEPEERAQVERLRAELEEFRQRFYAQFKKPDPEAPFEKKPVPGSEVLRRKQYAKLDNFIQAIFRERARQQS